MTGAINWATYGRTEDAWCALDTENLYLAPEEKLPQQPAEVQEITAAL